MNIYFSGATVFTDRNWEKKSWRTYVFLNSLFLISYDAAYRKCILSTYFFLTFGVLGTTIYENEPPFPLQTQSNFKGWHI